MLIILGGLPGVGKSTIAKQLSEKLQAVYLRIDSIEQAFKDAAEFNKDNHAVVVAEGYMAACAIAKDNLDIGLSVVADSVNPIALTRQAFRKVAETANTPFLEVELICTDKAEHQKRIETRQPLSPNFTLPTWQQVCDRDYEPWETNPLTIDTASTTAKDAVDSIIHRINEHKHEG